jgi:hypothetical protein
VYLADVDLPFSYQIQMDAVDFVRELSRVMQDAIVQLTKTGYTTGTGSTQPKGYLPKRDRPDSDCGRAHCGRCPSVAEQPAAPVLGERTVACQHPGDQYDLRDRDHQ